MPTQSPPPETLPELPPLPDLFGNPMVRDFNEIVPAAGIDWMPQTPGWYLLGAVLLLAGVRALWRFLKRWLRNRYRREALRRLDRLHALETEPVAAMNATNEVLKLVAMTASSRAEVASLSGSVWRHWLQSRTSTPTFSDESLELLDNALYNPAIVPPASAGNQFLNEAKAWVIAHRDDHGPA